MHGVAPLHQGLSDRYVVGLPYHWVTPRLLPLLGPKKLIPSSWLLFWPMEGISRGSERRGEEVGIFLPALTLHQCRWYEAMTWEAPWSILLSWAQALMLAAFLLPLYLLPEDGGFASPRVLSISCWFPWPCQHLCRLSLP